MIQLQADTIQCEVSTGFAEEAGARDLPTGEGAGVELLPADSLLPRGLAGVLQSTKRW